METFLTLEYGTSRKHFTHEAKLEAFDRFTPSITGNK